MTAENLDRMERMWADGASIYEMASELGYSIDYLCAIACRNRKRFPLRRSKVDEERMSKWVARIHAGRASIKEAAKAMGVNTETVRRRMHGRKA